MARTEGGVKLLLQDGVLVNTEGIADSIDFQDSFRLTDLGGGLVSVELFGVSPSVLSLTENKLIRGNASNVGVETTNVIIDSSDNISGLAGVTATSFTIGANTLDTNEFGFLDGQDQLVNIGASPTFDGTNFTGIPVAGIVLATDALIRGSAGGVGIESVGATLDSSGNFDATDLLKGGVSIGSTDSPTSGASLIGIAKGSGSPTVDQVQEYLDNTGSSGYFTGGIITDGGSGTIDITAGQGFIRTSSDDNAPLLSFSWDAVTGLDIPDNTTRYVFVDDTGAITLNASEFTEAVDNIMLGVATDEGGTVIHPFNLGVRLQESIGQMGRYIRRVDDIVRDKRKGGLIFGQSGDANRDVTMTQGSLWWGRTEYPISAFDTGGADTFETYSASGQEATGVSQFPNEQYDNAGTLTTMTNNRWAVLWFYIEPDDHIVMIYGRAQYVTEGQAEDELAPSSNVPNRISAASTIASKWIFQKGDDIASKIETAFGTPFMGSGVTDHGNLAGLGDDDHTQYLLADGTRPLTANWDVGNFDLTAKNYTGDGVLTMTGAGDSSFVGNVGIGTDTPTRKLDVRGDISVGIDGVGGSPGKIIFRNAVSQSSDPVIEAYDDRGTGAANSLKIGVSSTNGVIDFFTGVSPLLRMRIDEDGKVDIRANSELVIPVQLTQQNDAGFVGMNFFDDTDTLRATIAYGNENAVVFPKALWIGHRTSEIGNDIIFTTSNTQQRLIIKKDGEVGIGTDSPATRLHLSPSSGASELRIQTADTNDPKLSFKTTNTANQVDIFLNEDSGTDNLEISSIQTGGLFVDLNAKTGGVPILRFFGTGHAEIRRDVDGTFRINAVTQDADIVFEIDDGGVDKDVLVIQGSSGNVGIGTTTPDYNLEIEGAGADLNLKATTTTGTEVGNKDNRLILQSNSGTVGNGGEIVWMGGSDIPTARWAAITGHIKINSGVNAAGEIRFATKASTDTVLLPRMTINASGNVGIGTDAPDTKLHIKEDSVSDLLTLDRTSGGYDKYTMRFNAGSGLTIFNVTDTRDELRFKGDGAVIIDGSLGIGTGAPSVPLHVVGDVMARFERTSIGTFPFIELSATGSEPQILFDRGSGAFQFAIGVSADNKFKISDAAAIGAQDRFVIDSNGKVGIGTASPAAKLEVDGDVIITGDLTSKTLNEISSQDLVFAMNFNSETILAENVLDSSGYNFHGVAIDSPTHDVTGGFNGGGVFEFNGTSNFIDMGEVDVGVGKDTLTIAAWIKPMGAVGSYALIGKGQYATAGESWAVAIPISANRLAFSIGNVFTYINDVITVGEWQHIAVVYDKSLSGLSNQVAFYINGVDVGNSVTSGVAITIPDSANDFAIGSSKGGRFFDGSIDDMRVYERVLSPQEIKTLYLQRGEIENSYVSQKDVRATSAGDIEIVTGNLGIGATIPSEKLDVAGNIILTGELMGSRQTIILSRSAQFSASDSEVFLKAGEVQTDGNIGIVMIRDGSIVGLSANYRIVSNAGTNNVILSVAVDGSSSWENSIDATVGTGKRAQFTQARGVETFSAGDVLSISLTETDEDAVVFENVIGLIEIVYDD